MCCCIVEIKLGVQIIGVITILTAVCEIITCMNATFWMYGDLIDPMYGIIALAL